MIGRVRSLIIKEFFAVWRDKRSRVILIVPPLVQMLIFTFAATQEVTNVPIAILKKDSGLAARDLVARFAGTPNFTRIITLRSDAEVGPVVDSRQALMVVQIGIDFSRDVEAGRRATVQLIMDGRRANAAQLVAGYALEIISRFDSEIGAAQGRPAGSSTIVDRVWFNPNLDPKWSTVPALVAILTTLMGLMITGLSVAREREIGTFDQLLVSPLSPTEILIGKSVPALVIGVAEATGMVLVGVFVFGVPFRGSLPLLYGSSTLR